MALSVKRVSVVMLLRKKTKTHQICAAEATQKNRRENKTKDLKQKGKMKMYTALAALQLTTLLLSSASLGCAQLQWETQEEEDAKVCLLVYSMAGE